MVVEVKWLHAHIIEICMYWIICIEYVLNIFTIFRRIILPVLLRIYDFCKMKEDIVYRYVMSWFWTSPPHRNFRSGLSRIPLAPSNTKGVVAQKGDFSIICLLNGPQNIETMFKHFNVNTNSGKPFIKSIPIVKNIQA
jgi:hypothetical protein